MPGSAIRYLEMFRALVGERSMPNVILTTTMWGKLTAEAEGLAREQELRETYWSLMEAHGSHIEIYDGSSEMAEEIVVQLTGLDNDIVLQLQEEMCIQHKRLDQTSAGGILVPDMDRALREHDVELSRLDIRIEEVTKIGNDKAKKALELQRLEVESQRQRKAGGRNRLKRDVSADAKEQIEKKKYQGIRDGLQVLAMIIGVTVNIVIHFLPM